MAYSQPYILPSSKRERKSKAIKKIPNLDFDNKNSFHSQYFFYFWHTTGQTLQKYLERFYKQLRGQHRIKAYCVFASYFNNLVIANIITTNLCSKFVILRLVEKGKKANALLIVKIGISLKPLTISSKTLNSNQLTNGYS